MGLAFKKTITVLFTFLPLFSAEARDFVFQNFKSENLSQVEVENRTRQVQPVWVIFYQDEFAEEAYFEIPARSSQVLNLDGIKHPSWSFAILSKNAQVFPVSKTNSIWDRTLTTAYEMKVGSLTTVDLNFFNLFIEKQKIKLTYLQGNSVLDSEIFTTARYRQSLKKNLNLPTGTTMLKIESEAPFLLSSAQIFKPVLDQSRKVSPDFKYFLVQGSDGDSSFIAPIQDPELILLARKEILNPQGSIVFADIEANTTEANRDFGSSEKPYWSWKIQKVTGMSQIGADWCQAYPEMIERMLQPMLRQRSVCFRGQRIIRELKPAEVESGILN